MSSGHPSVARQCSRCPSQHAAARDGLCCACRLRRFCRKPTYVWTPDHLAGLRRAYQAKNRPALSAAIKELQRRSGFPRCVLQNKAQELGLRCIRPKPWGAQDVDLLREFAGELPVYKLARALGRSESAVKNKLHLLQICARISEGYSRHELAQQMGSRHALIEQWIRRGWLRLDDNDRITETSLRRFLFDHMDEYRFRNCDEAWLKTMLNPKLGRIEVVRPERCAETESRAA